MAVARAVLKELVAEGKQPAADWTTLQRLGDATERSRDQMPPPVRAYKRSRLQERPAGPEQLPAKRPNRSLVGLAFAVAVTHRVARSPTQHLRLWSPRYKLNRAVTYDDGRS